MFTKDKSYKIFFSFILLFFIATFFLISSNKSAIYAEQKAVYNIEQPKQNYTEKDLDSYFCLRDENIIFTANQGNLGLCWAFGAIKSLESTLAIKYNEVYDFSEAWISLCLKLYRSSNNKSYQMGAGAEIPDFWNVLQNYGLVLESDFPYEMYMGFDETNMMEYYEYYKQFANKDIIKLLDKVDMTTLSNSSFNSKETIKQAKLHIMNHGGLYIAFKSQNASTKDVSNGKNKIKAYCNTSGSGDHSVAVLGWDDDITVTTKSGTEMKGAWICLNSWGNIEDDGFIYIMYEDTSIYDLVGFEINEEIAEFSVNMTKSTSYVKNLYKNYAKAKYEDFDIQRLKQGNMFYLGDTVDITYNSSVDVKNVNVEIYESGEICTDLNIDKENRKIRLYSSDLKQGCYKLLFSFDKDLDGNIEQQIVKQIFMTSGVIFDGIYTAMVKKPLPWVDFNDDDNLIKPSLPSESGGAELGNSVIFTQGYSTQSIKFKTANIPTCISSQLCANSIYIGSYSTITKIEVTNYTNKPYSTSFLANYFKSQKAYSTYRYLIQMEFTNQNCKVGDIKFIDLTFTTDRGHTETLRINFIITNQSKNDDIIYLNYLTNINNVVDCPKIAYYNGNDIIIPSANNKTYYTFEKWCTDNNLTNNINQNGNNYIITANLTKYVSSKTHRHGQFEPFRYITLYPLYEKMKFETESVKTLENATYFEDYSYEFDLAIKGSGYYEYNYKSGNLPNGLFITNGTLAGKPLKSGNFNFTISVFDTVLEEEKNCDCIINVDKVIIEYEIPSYSSNFGESLEKIEPFFVSDNIAHKDNADIEIQCDAVIGCNVGSYPITLTSNNDNYIINYNQDAVYTILPIDIVVTINPINLEYDGQNHTIDYQIANDIGKVNVYYSMDNDIYYSSLEFKDAINKTVYLRFEAPSENYKDTTLTTNVTITKRVLKVVLGQTKLKYNFQNQLPSYQIQNKVDGEDVQYSVNGARQFVGNHTMQFILLYPSSNNYQFEESIFEYEIVKIEPVYTTPKVVNSDLKNAKYLRDIALPKGYSWKYPDQTIREGTNIAYCVYTPENTTIYESVSNIRITFTKPDEKSKYILISVIAILSGFVLLPFVVIISKSMRTRRFMNKRLY